MQTNDGDRILPIGQTDPIENGIRIAHAGAWERAGDMPDGSSAESAFTFISEGTTYADTGWLCTTDAPNDIVGTDPLTWVQFSTFPLATNPPADVSRSAALVGVSNAAAREDHKHDVVTGLPATQDIGAGTTGTGPGIALSNHVHPVTAPAAPVNVNGLPADAGTSANFARQDHKHDVDFGNPVAVGFANAQGVSDDLSRADHVHANGPFVGEIIVADRAAVTALPTANIPLNTYARPRTIGQPFELVPAAQVAAVDGANVLASDNVGLVWARRLLPVPQWTAQLTWYVDPTTLNYDNDGATPGTPVPTLAEVARRLRVISASNYVVNLLTSDPTIDTFNFCPQFNGANTVGGALNATVTIQGPAQTVLLGAQVTQGLGITTFGTTPTIAANQQAQLNGDFRGPTSEKSSG